MSSHPCKIFVMLVCLMTWLDIVNFFIVLLSNSGWSSMNYTAMVSQSHEYSPTLASKEIGFQVCEHQHSWLLINFNAFVWGTLFPVSDFYLWGPCSFDLCKIHCASEGAVSIVLIVLVVPRAPAAGHRQSCSINIRHHNDWCIRFYCILVQCMVTLWFHLYNLKIELLSDYDGVL